MHLHLTRDQAYDFVLRAQERRQAARDAEDEPAQIEAAKDCGIGHFFMGDVGLSIRLFDEAKRLIHKTGTRRELLPTVIGMTGRALQRQKKWNDALDRYREAAATAEELDLPAHHLRWRGKEATTLVDMQRPEGIAKLEQSIDLGRALLAGGIPGGADELAGQMSSLAAALEEKDRPRAETLWTEVFGLLEPLPRGRRHYLATNNYATTLHKWGFDHQAQTYLEEALEIGRQVGADPEELLIFTHRRAELRAKLYGYEMAGDWLVAQCSFYPHKAWEIFQHAVALYERGFFWTKMKAASIEWRKLPVPTPVYKPLFEMALRYSFACRGVGDFDEALAALEEAGKYADEWGNPGAIAAVRGQTVLVLVDRGDFQNAVSRAGELWNEGARDRLLARAFVGALIGSGETNRALQVLDEFKRHGGGAVDAAWMSARLADAGTGDPLKAWYEYGAVAHTERDREAELEALNRLIDLYPSGSQEKFDAGRERLRLIDKVRSNVNDLFSNSAWLSVTPKASDFPVYLDSFLETAIVRKSHENAIYELERFRSQMLVDLLAERGARWRHDQPEGVQARSFVTNMYDRARYRYQGLLASGAGWEVRRTAAKELDRLRGLTAGAGGIIHVAAGWQGLHFPQSYQEFFDETILQDGEALLFQHVFAERTVFWLLGATGRIHFKEVKSFSRNTLEEMYTVFRSYRRGGMNRDARDLSTAVLGENGEGVLVDLDTSLAQPLIAWLKTIPAARVFLIAGTSAAILPLYACRSVVEAGIEIAVLPTSRALRFTREPRMPPVELFGPVNLFEDRNDFAAARDRIALVIDPTQTLTYAPWEAGVVKLALGDRQVEVFDQDPVDKQRLCRVVRIADVFHLIVHGTFDDASPYRSGVYLKGPQQKERFWTIADVFGDLDAPLGRLAVLSGCETGLSRPNLVSEEISLPAALIAAGFAAVIASKWSVDDLSTALLMGEFYRRWYAGGVTVCRALSEGVQWLRNLQRPDAIALLESSERGLAEESPGSRATGWQAIVSKAVKTVQSGPERPFEAAYHWAPFFVAGDGFITADGVDSRELASAGSGNGH